MSSKLKIAALAGAAAFALAGSAGAQDWGGAYVGVTVGAGFAGNDDQTVRFDTNLDGQFNDTVLTSAGANAFSPGFCEGQAATTTPAGGCSKDDAGFDIGLRAGYDWQVGGFIAGVVADISSADVESSVSAFSTTPANYNFTRELDWSAAIRGRVGAPIFGSYLGYVTAGYVKAQIDHTFSTGNVTNTFTVTDDNHVDGYQLGAGVERMWRDDWVVGLEYLFTSLDDEDFSVRAAGPAPAGNAFLLVNAAGTDLRPSDEDFEIHSVRFTASRRF